MSKLLSSVVALVIGLSVSGCYTDFGPVELAQNPEARAFIPTRIQTGDRIKVTVYGEDSLNGVYDVDPTGNVTVPLAGSIRAAGRSKGELQHEITMKYKNEYLQDPKVTVDIVGYRAFYLMGEVEHPGEFSYKSSLNVLSAITMAGGLTYRASRSSVLIQHPGQSVWQEYALLPTVMVGPGDLIRVPERYF